MIPRAYIDEWRLTAPWSQDAWVEQDLVISRAIVEIFKRPELRERLAFRGGTALHKLFLAPASRYSEDIDLVQVIAAPIGDTFDRLRAALDPWLGVPKRDLREGRTNLVYRFDSEAQTPIRMRLKVEINSREHFTELGHVELEYSVESRWFRGSAPVRTFAIEELLATKLRALYQRRKGRDLFDLWLALERLPIDPAAIIRCFERYMTESGHAVTRAHFEQNLAEKRHRADFRGDLAELLRTAVPWDFDRAYDLVMERVVQLVPGDPWRGAQGTRLA